MYCTCSRRPTQCCSQSGTVHRQQVLHYLYQNSRPVWGQHEKLSEHQHSHDKKFTLFIARGPALAWGALVRMRSRRPKELINRAVIFPLAGGKWSENGIKLSWISSKKHLRDALCTCWLAKPKVAKAKLNCWISPTAGQKGQNFTSMLTAMWT